MNFETSETPQVFHSLIFQTGKLYYDQINMFADMKAIGCSVTLDERV